MEFDVEQAIEALRHQLAWKVPPGVVPTEYLWDLECCAHCMRGDGALGSCSGYWCEAHYAIIYYFLCAKCVKIMTTGSPAKVKRFAAATEKNLVAAFLDWRKKQPHA